MNRTLTTWIARLVAIAMVSTAAQSFAQQIIRSVNPVRAIAPTGQPPQSTSRGSLRNAPAEVQPAAPGVDSASGIMPAANADTGGAPRMANAGQRSRTTPYVPQHLRSANHAAESNNVRQASYTSPRQTPQVEPVPAQQPAPMMASEVPLGDTYFDGAYGDQYLSAGDDCGLECRPGGCPPELIGDCWIGRLGNVLRDAEYFAGAHGFSSISFAIPGANLQTEDSSFGFHGGVNVGIPLCRLTCGLVSGQIGVRTVQSNFDGTLFTADDRDQLFVTTGLYRRVDYGLQFGVVLDYLRENWFTNIDVMQLRGDLSWVYPSGSAIGYRFAESVQDDETNGIINGLAFTGLVSDLFDTHRFYYRHASPWGGFTDVFAGFSDEKHFIMGLDVDVALTETVALQSGFNYLLPDEDTRALIAPGQSEAWNVYVGFVWRPQGRDWYRSYDRPILPVADNGSMILRRRF